MVSLEFRVFSYIFLYVRFCFVLYFLYLRNWRIVVLRFSNRLNLILNEVGYCIWWEMKVILGLVLWFSWFIYGGGVFGYKRLVVVN